MSHFAFLSQNSFARAPLASVATPFAVAGIAWDGAVTNRPGARFGPRAIREASHMLCDAIHPHFNVTPDGLLGDAGDLLLPNTSLGGMRAAMQAPVAALILNHHMCWLGGDHSITLALLRAYKAWLGRPLAEEMADLPFVGMDCVEVAPPYDHAELTSQAAASFVWTYLCGQIARRSQLKAGAPSSS